MLFFLGVKIIKRACFLSAILLLAVGPVFVAGPAAALSLLLLSPPENVTAEYSEGNILVTWDNPDTGTLSAERYIIIYGVGDSFSTAVATGNVGDSTAPDTRYSFSCESLQSALGVADCVGKFSFRVVSNNTTDRKSKSVYSAWSNIATVDEEARLAEKLG